MTLHRAEPILPSRRPSNMVLFAPGRFHAFSGCPGLFLVFNHTG